jgi:3-hydroxyisobutyrate dehydrogenase-like beta-hydroxyacid dehydrogenase
VVEAGPLGAGMKTKLARNVVVYGSWLVHYQAQLLAETAGVELAKLRQVIDASEREMDSRLPLFLSRDTVAPTVYEGEAARRWDATSNLAHKDLRAALNLARMLDVDLPLVELADSYVETMMGIQQPQVNAGGDG